MQLTGVGAQVVQLVLGGRVVDVLPVGGADHARAVQGGLVAVELSEHVVRPARRRAPGEQRRQGASVSVAPVGAGQRLGRGHLQQGGGQVDQVGERLGGGATLDAGTGDQQRHTVGLVVQCGSPC